MHSRHSSTTNEPDPIATLLECKVPLTDGLVRVIVSAAENPDDAMRTVCMETLVEIGQCRQSKDDLEVDFTLGLLDLARLVQSDAFRTILLAFKDGPAELGPAMTGLLLYLTNQPSSRHLLLPGSDLEVCHFLEHHLELRLYLCQTVLVGLTEEYGKVPSRQVLKFVEKLQYSVRNVSMLLGSWPGEFGSFPGN
jgi:hypothetical protein